MIKDQPWLPGTLKAPAPERGRQDVSGAELGASTVRHDTRKPARQVLEWLLPEGQGRIINVRRSRDELLQASGYAARPEKFAELLKILTDDLPLVMEVEADEDEGDRTDARHRPSPTPVQYRLTHEYLLKAAAEPGWRRATRKSSAGEQNWRCGKRTRNGRHRDPKEPAKRDPTYLPGPSEYRRILCLAPRSEFGDDQKDLMRAAHGGMRNGAGAGCCGVLIGLIVGVRGCGGPNRRRRGSMHPEDGATPAVSSALAGLGTWPGPGHCRHVINNDEADSQAKDVPSQAPAAYLGSVHTGAGRCAEFLVEQVVVGPPGECANIVAALAHDPAPAIEKISHSSESAEVDQQVRLATVALHLGSPDLATQMLQSAARTLRCGRSSFTAIRSWYGEAGRLRQDSETERTLIRICHRDLRRPGPDRDASDRTTARSLIASFPRRTATVSACPGRRHA